MESRLFAKQDELTKENVLAKLKSDMKPSERMAYLENMARKPEQYEIVFAAMTEWENKRLPADAPAYQQSLMCIHDINVILGHEIAEKKREREKLNPSLAEMKKDYQMDKNFQGEVKTFIIHAPKLR